MWKAFAAAVTAPSSCRSRCLRASDIDGGIEVELAAQLLAQAVVEA
jgi:hypothetical protein